MSQKSLKWDDLGPRLITGIALIAVGVVEILLGGAVFAITVALVTGVIIWELARMIAPEKPSEAMILAVVSASCLLLSRNLDAVLILPLLLAPALAGAVLLRQHMGLFAIYAVAVMMAGYALAFDRDAYGAAWLFWLVCVVAATDIAGYFGGRLIGGAKFWPSISPKKTWAGIVTGWGAAAIVGWIYVLLSGANQNLVWISVIVAFASQMGDIAQSAVKRKMGVKDSSNLLPGHGGLFDRFDALLGAALFMLVIDLVIEVPEIHF